MKDVYIAPSLLSANFAHLQKDIETVESAGAEILHLDVMDGNFVKNITFGPCVIKCIREITKMQFDVHLMIDRPEEYVEDFLRIGCQWLSFHIEATDCAHEIIKKIKQYNCKAAIAIKPNTDISTIIPYLADLDMVLVMSVEPGFGGQKFIEKILKKIIELRKLPNCPKYIEVDGGINQETAIKAAQAGANIFVAGSYIFKSNQISKTIHKLRDVLYGLSTKKSPL
ncbi:ribulose-phosphate 3-epimerase [Candidatus Uabimicrobium sp. HlEnr_7]|uniref:ribulose-phosphate 3-epimerase n=1 Tax=Candidatus Uabimicrobium helgolandensis TaxID=3095367 RepID=UPI0035585AC5